MTYQEAMKVIELNVGKLSRSMQLAVETVVRDTRKATCKRLKGIFESLLEDAEAPGHGGGMCHLALCETLQEVIDEISDFGGI